MARSYGSDAKLYMKREAVYGVPPGGNYYAMPFTGSSLGSEQGLIDDPVLGFGRDPEQPLLDVINDDGDISIPVDPRYMGLWLTGLFGDPQSSDQVAATGTIAFLAQPDPGDTITINGVEFEFVDSSPSGNEIEIQGTLGGTVDQIVTVLNATANTSVDDATYSKPTGTTILLITHDTVGQGGNAFTLAGSFDGGAATATVSGATLTGGGYEHVFYSGESDLPSYSIEVAHPKVPAHFLHDGCRFNSIALNFQRSGPATATISVIGRGETRFDESQAGTPAELTFSRISQFKGAVKSEGAFLGNLTGATMTYSNNLEKIETIRDDEKIEGTDPIIASLTGSLNVRFADTTLMDKASAGIPVDLEFSYTLAAGYKITFICHEVFLPKPKQPIQGPGGVQASFDFRGARNQSVGRMMTVKLLNNLDGTQYA